MSEVVPLRDNALGMWTVYNHPFDYPDSYVARLWVVSSDGNHGPTETMIVTDDLGYIREKLASRGLVRLERDERDDPKIMETWL